LELPTIIFTGVRQELTTTIKSVWPELAIALCGTYLYHLLLPNQVDITHISDTIKFISSYMVNLFTTFFATLAIVITLKFTPRWTNILNIITPRRIKSTFFALTSSTGLISLVLATIIYTDNINLGLANNLFHIIIFSFIYAIIAAFWMGFNVVREAINQLK